MGPIGDIPCLIPLVKSMCCMPSKRLETAASFPLENLLKNFFIKKFFYCLKNLKSQSRDFRSEAPYRCSGFGVCTKDPSTKQMYCACLYLGHLWTTWSLVFQRLIVLQRWRLFHWIPNNQMLKEHLIDWWCDVNLFLRWHHFLHLSLGDSFFLFKFTLLGADCRSWSQHQLD